MDAGDAFERERAIYLDEFRMRIERDGLDAALSSAVETILLYRSMSSSGMRRGNDLLVVDVRPVAETT